MYYVELRSSACMIQLQTADNFIDITFENNPINTLS